MVREVEGERPAPSSRNVFAFATPRAMVYGTVRSERGKNTRIAGQRKGTPLPCWFKATRVGDRFDLFSSTDSLKWHRISSHTAAIGEDVFVGYAVTSHEPAKQCTAVFDDLTIVVGKKVLLRTKATAAVD